jgi:hypothetical protein
MDSIHRGGGHRYLAGDLDVETIGYQRFLAEFLSQRKF